MLQGLNIESCRKPLTAAGWLACLVAAFAATVAIPWTDEVFYADPGVGFALGQGFRSSDWSPLGGDAAWGLSNPGVGMLLAVWCKLLGVGAVSVHAFFIVVFVGGFWLLSGWLVSRLGLPSWARPLVLTVGMASHSLSGNAMHHARPDAFWPLLAWLFLESSFGSGGFLRRAAFAVGLGVGASLLGLQFCAYFALAAALLFLFRRDRQTFILGLWLAFGMLLALAALWAAYESLGIWGSFVESRRTSLGVRFEPGFWLISPDLFILFPLSLALLRHGDWRSPAASAPLVLLLLVPAAMHLAGRYQAPYSWMTTAPALFFLLKSAVEVRPFRRPFAVGLCVLLLLGLAARVRDAGRSVSDAITRREALSALLRAAPPGSAPGLVSVPLYYDVRAAGYDVVVAFNHVVPPRGAASSRVEWALLSDVDVPLLTPRLPGRWERSAVILPGVLPAGHGGFVLLRRKP